MFNNHPEQPAKSKKKRDIWFYITILASLVLISAIGFAVARYYGIDSIDKIYSREMKVEGEIFIVTKGRTNVKLGLVEVCAIPEEQIIDWIDEKERKAKIERDKTKKALDFARQEKMRAEQDYKMASRRTDQSFNQALDGYGYSSGGWDKYQAAQNDARQKAKYADERSEKLIKAGVDYIYWFSPKFYLEGLQNCEAVTKTNSDGKFTLTLKRKKYALAARSERKIIEDTEEYFWLIWIEPEMINEKPMMLSNDNLMDSNPQNKVIEIRVPEL